MGALVAHRREFLNFRERLILKEAWRRKDFTRMSDIVQSVACRSLDSPAPILHFGSVAEKKDKEEKDG